VDAGIAILEGTKVSIAASHMEKIKEANPAFEYVLGQEEYVLKGVDLAGLNGIHFRQDSLNGAIRGFRSGRQVVLNSELH